jgi:Ca2+-binding EF-hand superfamily protein
VSFLRAQLHHDATSFDHIGHVLVVLFQVMTTEGWTTIFEPLLRMANPVVVRIYFVSLIFMTSFFMVNFVMAQMVVAFSRACEEQDHKRPPELSSVDILINWIRKARSGGSGDTDFTTDVWAMREQFNICDRDKSGELDEVEVKELARRLGMDLTLREMDASGDGTVDYPEFEGWWRMRGLFDKVDSDGSGSLDKAEAKELAEQLGTDLDMDEMDHDEDGNITYVEFAAWWNMRNKFNDYDANHSGTLTEDEISKLANDMDMSINVEEIDMDGDGECSYEEFALWFQMRRAFDKLDSDGGGTLDSNEVHALGALLKMELEVSDMDPDGTGEVSFANFEAWWGNEGKQKKAVLREMAVAAQFDYTAGSLRGFVTHQRFVNVVLVAVCLNFALLCTDHHEMDKDMYVMVEYINVTFNIFFALEMVVKMAGLGPYDYFSERFNCLDFFIVLTSVAEMIATDGGGAVSSLRTLRLIRVVRAFKVFGSSPNLKKLLEVTLKSGAAIGNFAILLFFFIVIYALVGMNLFGVAFTSPVYAPPGRFDNFYWAFLTVFQVLTRENWHDLLYTGFHGHGLACFAYFASLIVVTNYMILSLFLGNLLHTLEDVFLREATKMRNSAVQKTQAATNIAMKMTIVDANKVIGAAAFATGASKSSDPERQKEAAAMVIQREWAKYRLRIAHEAGEVPAATFEEPSAPWSDKAFNLFGTDHPLRASCTQLSEDPRFQGFVLICIIISSLCLAYEHPLDDPESAKTQTLFGLDVLLTLIFTFEMFLAMMKKGLIQSSGCYLRNWWDIVDFLIVLVSIVGLVPAAKDMKTLRVMRLFRILRPLRALRRFPQLCTITQALLTSLVPVAIVGAIATFVTAMFAVVFISLLKGRLFHCSIDGDKDAHADYTQFKDCIGQHGEWVNSDQNYDNMAWALLTLFEVMTLEDWQGAMYAAIDTSSKSVGFRETYEREYRGTPAWGVAFMIFIIVGGLFFLNLLVGVVVNAFDMADKMGETGQAKVEAKARKQTWMISMVAPIMVTPWYDSMRKPCHALMLSAVWDSAVGVCIILNVLVMGLDHAEQSDGFADVIWDVNLFFTVIFTIELVVKVVALHPLRCFMDGWNVFDLFLVTTSLIEIGAEIFGTEFFPFSPSALRTFRIFRLTRLIKLVPHSEGLQAVFHTFIEAMPVLINVGIMMGAVFFMYDVLAVNLFSPVTPTGCRTPGECTEEMTEYMNFEDFWSTWFTLFVLATGEHWNAIMHEVMKSEAGPGLVPTVAFFVTFQFLAVFLTLNLFISVIVAYTQKADDAKYERAKNAGEDGVQIEEPPDHMEWSDMDAFLIAWAEQDPQAMGAIHGEDELRKLALRIGELGSFLGAKNEEDMQEILDFITEKRYTGRMYFSAVAHMMAACAFHSVLPEEIDLTGADSSLGDATVTTNPLQDSDDEDATETETEDEAGPGLD